MNNDVLLIRESAKIYDFLRIGSEMNVIKQRNWKNESFSHMVALHDYYEKIFEAHV